MKCPDEIAEIILKILAMAASNIKGAAHRGDAEQCFHEADHIHNLPDLLREYDPNKLKYYWDIERISYIKHSQKGFPDSYIPLWEQLKAFVDHSHPFRW